MKNRSKVALRKSKDALDMNGESLRALWSFVPQIFVWGSLFLVLHPARAASRLPPPLLHHTQLVHTQLPHTQLVHTQLPHTHLPHIQIVHAQLVFTQLIHILPPHTHNLSTYAWQAWHLVTSTVALYNLSTHNLSSRNLFTHFITHNLSTYQAWHLVTATFTLRGKRGTWRHRASLGDSHLHLAWQAWHLVTSTVTLYNLSTRNLSSRNLFTHFITHNLSTYQAWHLVTATFTLRGRRGNWWHRLSLCVAGVALAALGRLWWRTGFPADAVGAAALCVAGVALDDSHRHFAWQAWHLATSSITFRGRRGTYGTGPALVVHRVPSWRRGRRCSLRGRPGTWRHPASLCVASVALTARGRRGVLHGRHGTWRERASLCVAGVAIGDIQRHFAWQAWHLCFWAGFFAWHLRARQGRGDIRLHFAGQLWHLWHMSRTQTATTHHITII